MTDYSQLFADCERQVEAEQQDRKASILITESCIITDEMRQRYDVLGHRKQSANRRFHRAG